MKHAVCSAALAGHQPYLLRIPGRMGYKETEDPTPSIRLATWNIYLFSERAASGSGPALLAAQLVEVDGRQGRAVRVWAPKCRG